MLKSHDRKSRDGERRKKQVGDREGKTKERRKRATETLTIDPRYSVSKI